MIIEINPVNVIVILLNGVMFSIEYLLTYSLH